MSRLTILLTSTRRRHAAAFICGILATLALPPLHIIITLIPAFSGLLWLTIMAPSRRQAFWAGWWFGFGHFLTGLYWITFAIMVEADKFWWLIPIAVAAISAVVAVYIAIVTLITYSLPAGRIGKVILFASIWVGVEYIRAYLFTGFPWNLIGYSWSGFLPMLQLAAITGVYGLSFLAVIVGAAPMMRNRWAMMAVLLITVGVWSGGAWRLHNAKEAFVPGVQLRLVQGAIPQDQKWQPSYRLEVLNIYKTLSETPTETPITHLIWPETAIPFFLKEGEPIMNILQSIIPPNGYLLTGVLRGEETADVPRYWNAFQAVNSEGRIVSTYDKFHLVPFGEYIPLRQFLPFVKKITHGAIDFSTGDGPKTLTLPNTALPAFSPLICYEGIFSGHVVEKDTHPHLLINVTNDAWFGTSSGPYQHFEMVRVRAVEEGVPLVRAANNGISAVIDGYGRIVAYAPLNDRDVIDSKLPAPIVGNTLYSKTGSVLLLPAVFLLIVIVVLAEKFLRFT